MLWPLVSTAHRGDEHTVCLPADVVGAGGLQVPMVKLIMSWNIRPGQEQPYFEFIVQEFAPGLMRLGLQTVEVLYTIHGDAPQIVTYVVARDLDTLRKIMQTEEWRRLMDRLLRYVSDYQQKVVYATGRLQF